MVGFCISGTESLEFYYVRVN